MGGPSFNIIGCANQNNERKYLSRGICPRGSSEKKEPFESKCDSGTYWAYFMAYGVIESISMSAFVVLSFSVVIRLFSNYMSIPKQQHK
jgi:hypothetical protein